MKRPKFIGIFPSQFPGWGSDVEPHFHHKMAQSKDGEFVYLKEKNDKPCDMAFHPPGGGSCMSVRYNPMGVSGIDAAGNCWVLVQDFALQDSSGDRKAKLRWVKFETEVG